MRVLVKKIHSRKFRLIFGKLLTFMARIKQASSILELTFPESELTLDGKLVPNFDLTSCSAVTKWVMRLSTREMMGPSGNALL